MAFDNQYPNRKDHRAPYQKKPQRLDHTCRPGGSCPYCQSNRSVGTTKRLLATSLADWREYLPVDDAGRGTDYDDSTGQF